MAATTLTRKVTRARADKIRDELGSCVGSYVSINGARWYVGNIFDRQAGRGIVSLGGVVLFPRGPLRGDEYRVFSC